MIGGDVVPQSRLEKHVKVCKKVFSQKRKAFDSAANRLGNLENADALIANAKKIEKEKEKVALLQHHPWGQATSLAGHSGCGAGQAPWRCACKVGFCRARRIRARTLVLALLAHVGDTPLVLLDTLLFLFTGPRMLLPT